MTAQHPGHYHACRLWTGGGDGGRNKATHVGWAACPRGDGSDRVEKAHVVAPEDEQGDGDAQEERRRRVRLEGDHPVRGVALPALRLLAHVLRCAKTPSGVPPTDRQAYVTMNNGYVLLMSGMRLSSSRVLPRREDPGDMRCRVSSTACMLMHGLDG